MRLALTVLLAVALFGALPTAGQEGPGIYRSDDAGRSWTHVGGPDVDTYLTLLALDGGRLLLGTDRGAYLSDDEGRNWRDVGDRAPTYAFLVVDGRLWMGSEVGLYTSGDRGLTWALVPNVPAVTALVGTEGVLYAGTPEGLRMSHDGGGTWQLDSAGIEGGVLSLAAQVDTLLVGTTVGVFERVGGEAVFTSARGLPRGVSRALLLHTERGAFAAVGSNLYHRSAGWVRLTTLPLHSNGDPPIIARILPMGDGRTLLGTDRGLHSSEGWRLVPSLENVSHYEIAALARDPARPSRVFLGASAVPASIALAQAGIHFDAATSTVASEERFGVVIGVIFLIGAVMAIRFLARQQPRPT